MTMWIIPNKDIRRMVSGARPILGNETHILCCWNTDRNRGWKLYAINQSTQTFKLIKGAGGESISWLTEQATTWADQQLNPITRTT
jgi:hypothetical protein